VLLSSLCCGGFSPLSLRTIWGRVGLEAALLLNQMVGNESSPKGAAENSQG
jgi:hypothetical protein